jgi:hypothetical protein
MIVKFVLGFLLFTLEDFFLFQTKIQQKCSQKLQKRPCIMQVDVNV